MLSCQRLKTLAGVTVAEPIQKVAAAQKNAFAVILIMDQAGWHMSNNLIVPAIIIILPLPPKSPELNPFKNLWRFMRENWLSNRVYKSCDDIVDRCRDARQNLESQPWCIMSIGRREWANFLSSARRRTSPI
ncbi:transposase (plasmid) [Agrobacterium larrymoorei]|uniref:Transposase n=1 Tax=Agrobacterium larrymoorei TaxID=160699 RepID=A0ABX8TE35_9HYPH|nr:transposase [Agrobacterium larrymoorei]